MSGVIVVVIFDLNYPCRHFSVSISQ